MDFTDYLVRLQNYIPYYIQKNYIFQSVKTTGTFFEKKSSYRPRSKKVPAYVITKKRS